MHADGRPSGSLLRRVEAALSISKQYETPSFFVTGGAQSPEWPTEASVMFNLLTKSGIKKEQIIRDDVSGDTMDSVHCAAKLLGDYIKIIACSDRYHVLRITILLRMLKIPASPAWIAPGYNQLGRIRWAYMWFRDLVAIPYDVFLLCVHLLNGGRKNG